MLHPDIRNGFLNGTITGTEIIDLAISKFVQTRVIDQSKRVCVLFLREETADRKAYQIKIGADIEKAYPAIFSFPIEQLLDPSQREMLLSRIAEGAKQWADKTEPHKSAYAQEGHTLLQDMIKYPHKIYGRCVELTKKYDRDALVREESENNSFLIQTFKKLPSWLIHIILQDDALFRCGYKSLSASGTNLAQKGIKRLLNKLSNISLLGVASSSPASLEADKESFSGSIDWKDLSDLPTLWHEIGHRLSLLYGTLEKTGDFPAAKSVRASETEQWVKASHQSSLHLKFGIWVSYEDGQIPEELFAETTRFYLEEYLRHHGDEGNINKALERKIPSLWRVYRDEMIPFFEHSVAVAVASNCQSHSVPAAAVEKGFILS